MAPAKAQVIITSDTSYFLAIESGGSGTRVALADGYGHILQQARCESASPLYREAENFSAAFARALAIAMAAVTPEKIRGAGMAGPADVVLIRTTLMRLLPGLPIHEFTEGDLARSVHNIAAGVALVAGTGCSCSAVGDNGKLTTLGGYGPQFGDEGSAYWIGLEGLKAAFRAEQGRIASTVLLEAARNFYQIQSPLDILEEAESSGHVPAPRIAEFAVEVDRAMILGDSLSAAILADAGTHLGRLIVETARHTAFSMPPVPLALSGGAFRSTRLVDAVVRTVKSSEIPFKIFPVVHEPISGLIKLVIQVCDDRNG